jgi:ribonuclease HI
VTIGRLTAQFKKLSANCYEEQHELHGPVELDPDSKVFLGAKKLTNHTAELSGMCMALIYLITVSNSVSEVIILYDAATDAAAIAGSGGDGGMSENIHAGKPRKTPAENGALISTGQQLLKLVIAAGVKVMWCKVNRRDAPHERVSRKATARNGRNGSQRSQRLKFELGTPVQSIRLAHS